MRYSRKTILQVIFFAANFACVASFAQMPDYSNIGRAPNDSEVRAWDTGSNVDGKGLPPGSGTAKEGAQIYAKKCAVCHGPNLEGSILGSPLAGGRGSLTSAQPKKTLGSYWPFATSIWDYVNRAMPRWQEKTLSANEVYAVTAFLLYRNDIIKETDIIDAGSLPKVEMPNRNGFIPPRFEDIPDFKKRGCRVGQCP